MNFFSWIRIKKNKKQIHKFYAYVSEHFEKSKFLDGKDYAIGQYLDHKADEKQSGIYGTSSAVQVLHRSEKTKDYVTKFIDFLINSKSDRDSRFNKKDDFNITYKFCFFLDSLEPWSDSITETQYHAYFDDLEGRCINDHGWGEYFSAEADYEHPPKILSTCFALRSLRRYPKFYQSERCKKIIKSLLEKSQNPTHTLLDKAFLLITLSEYNKLPGFTENNIINKQVLNDMARSLVSVYIKEKGKRFFASTNRYHYTIKIGAVDTGNYLYFPEGAIVGHAILSSEVYNKYSSIIFKILKFYLKNVEDNEGGYKDDSNRQSTIDQLWISNFFEKLKQTNLSLWSFILQNKSFAIPVLVVGFLLYFGATILENLPPAQVSPEQTSNEQPTTLLTWFAYVKIPIIIFFSPFFGGFFNDVYLWLKSK